MGVSQMCVVLAGCWLAQWIVCVFVCVCVWGGGGGGEGLLLTELDDIDDMCSPSSGGLWLDGCVCRGDGCVCVCVCVCVAL